MRVRLAFAANDSACFPPNMYGCELYGISCPNMYQAVHVPISQPMFPYPTNNSPASPVRTHPARTVFALRSRSRSLPPRDGVSSVVPWDPTANDVHVRTELPGYDGAVRRLRIHRTACWRHIGTDQHATDRLCLAAQPEPRLCRRRPRRATNGLRGTSEGVGGQWCAPPAAARGRSLRGGSGAPAARTGRPAMPQPSAAAASLCASA